ncbi:5-formaminoimidazole-4-carboxamide-1-(beta)-D-ribofuranosyl 5'-monophosphate synthetase [groundwater metagenome]|uniref:5-formaminoimidazole-4-carboxamide-1-(Beta)-D-ribofuranosyl 5'-monophosphate synthetase n=1 Tax=groundwater metagenome TaxID=717931 RepID=A0A098E8Z7_9ZZZZ
MLPIIATLGSHSSLQILKGAKEEGFKTAVITKKPMVKIYDSFKVADEIIVVDDYKEMLAQKFSAKFNNFIFIPHGSFVEYIGYENMLKSNLKFFGNRKSLEWESNRRKMFKWLNDSNIKVPKIFNSPDEIDRPCIIKFYGAKGGKGYFFVQDENEFHKRMNNIKEFDDYIIQEYVVGTRFYPHYFYSNLNNELEFFGIDIRYETNADGIGRIPPKFSDKINPTYVVVGNTPVVIRESLLPRVFEMGENLVKASKKFFGGLWGPFCIETVLTEDMEFYAIEVSARIVAGTNLYVDGSQYTKLRYDEPMSTGRRIAREIKKGIETKRLGELLQ